MKSTQQHLDGGKAKGGKSEGGMIRLETLIELKLSAFRAYPLAEIRQRAVSRASLSRGDRARKQSTQ